MLDLDDVISKVGRIELSADTRQQHLARLLALQVSPAQICRIGPQAEASVGRRRPRAGLAGGLAAAAVVVVAGTSALLVPALQAPQIAPGAPGAVSTPAPSHSSAPTSRSAAPTTGSDAPTVPDAAFSKQLAGILGLTDAQATAVTAQLNNLGRHGGADPTSTQFIHIAESVGVEPARLAAAIDQIKKAQLAATTSTGPGQSKSGGTKPADSPSAPTTGTAQAMAKSTAQNSAQDLLSTDRSINLLASTLRLSRQKAAELASQLTAFEHGAGLDPQSSSFQTVAHNFGFTAEQLASAINQIKKAAGN